MDKADIGNLIHYERTKKKIALQELAEGICSESVIKRLEAGERLPDFFVLERIIERLGKSANKIEFLHNENVYEIYYLRELIENYVEQKAYEEAADALAYYEGLPEAKEPIHRQYICKMKAVLCGEAENDHERAAKLLEEAVEQTLPGFKPEYLDRYLLGEGEFILLLMWIQEITEAGHFPTESDGSRIVQYIERNCHDEEVRANVYSKAAWVLGNVALKRQDFQEALRYFLEGEKILAENGLLLHLLQLLEKILELTSKLDSAAYEEWKKQRDALKWVYEEYGEIYETEQIALWKNYRQQEVYLVSELFGQERKMTNQSQENLAVALEIDKKTISRIENGKYKPKPGTFQKMKEYLQIDRDICSTYLVVDDFELLEMEREIAKRSHYKNYKEAELLYERLRSRLSMEWNENRQYVKFKDAYFAKRNNLITNEETIKLCEEAFKMTRKDMEWEQIGQVVLTKGEAKIINYIALCYGKMGDRKRKIEILEMLKSAYENSKVDIKYHYIGMGMVYYHLSAVYEECDLFPKAMKMCDEGIQFEIRCKRGLRLGFFVDQKAYSKERMTGDKKGCQRFYRQAYQLFKLMKKERDMRSLQKIYLRDYGEEIE